MPKQKTPKNILTKSIPYIALLIALVMSGFLIWQTLLSQADTQEQKAQAFYFDNDHLALEYDGLTADFLQKDVNKEFNYDFKLTNKTDYDYENVELVVENKGQTQSIEKINLNKANSSDFTVKLLLSFPSSSKESKIVQYIKIKASGEVRENKLIASRKFESELNIPLELNFLNEEDILHMDFSASNATINYGKGKSDRTLDYSVNLQNKQKFPLNGILEVELLSSNGDKVQSLLVKQVNVDAEGSSSISDNYSFTLPPANLVYVGSQTYKLRAKLSIKSGSRNLEVERKSGDFKINVKEI
jgi:hypothetical protein